jgi:hypothetical protein
MFLNSMRVCKAESKKAHRMTDVGLKVLHNNNNNNNNITPVLQRFKIRVIAET